MEPKHLEGLVRKGIGGFYTVETSEGFYTCTARGKFRRNGSLRMQAIEFESREKRTAQEP